MSNWLIRGDISDEEKEAMLKVGFREETYTRQVVLDPSIAIQFQNLVARCLQFIPPHEHGLRNDMEAMLKVRYDQL